jgi:hypothetical protein
MMIFDCCYVFHKLALWLVWLVWFGWLYRLGKVEVCFFGSLVSAQVYGHQFPTLEGDAPFLCYLAEPGTVTGTMLFNAKVYGVFSVPQVVLRGMQVTNWGLKMQ